VHRDFLAHIAKYSDTSMIPTPYFFAGLKVGEQMQYKNIAGRDRYIKLSAIGNIQDDGMRRVFFDVNGLQNSFDVLDRTDSGATLADKREKADPTNEGHIACSMKGLVVDVLKTQGDLVEEGEPVAVLSAMKMETVISAPKSGRISTILVNQGDALDSGDLVAVIA
jgi:pyruvate carboxylase